MKTKTIYISGDGVEFDTPIACETYERSRKLREAICRSIDPHDVGGYAPTPKSSWVRKIAEEIEKEFIVTRRSCDQSS